MSTNQKLNGKQPVHQIINLDEMGEYEANLDQDQFIGDLALQCGNLLSWVGNSASQLRGETLWKNKMRIIAAEKFDELDSDEIRKLVDRDWRIMSEDVRRAVLTEFEISPDPTQLQSKLSTLKNKLQSIHQNK